MNYIDIIESDFYKNSYQKIEELKKDYPVNHGFVHIKNVLKNAKDLANIFKLSNMQRKNLYIACALHDVGYLNGRENHAKAGSEIAKDYLNKNGFLQKDIEKICNAIACHGGKQLSDYKDNVALCLILADKLDFAWTRYNPLDPSVKLFLAVDRVKFEKNDSATIKVYLKDDIDIQEFESAYTNRKLKKVLEFLTEVLNMPAKIQYIKI